VSDDRGRAQRSVDWQNRYITPGLLIIGLVVIGGSWAVGAIPAWLGIILLVFGALTLIGVLRKPR